MSRRYTRTDVENVAANLMRELHASKTLDADTTLVVGKGSVTYGNSWTLYTLTEGSMTPAKFVDLSGAFSAREAYERIRAALVMVQFLQTV